MNRRIRKFIGLLWLLNIISPILCASEMAESASAVYTDPPSKEYMTKWMIAGPFPFESGANAPADWRIEPFGKAFGFDFLTQQGGESSIRPQEGMIQIWKEKEYPWKFYRSGDEDIDLVKVFGETENAVAYAYAEIKMTQPMKIYFAVGSDDAVKIWLNGVVIHENLTNRPLTLDEDLVSAEWKEGNNYLLLKIVNGIREWGFSCRPFVEEDIPLERLISRDLSRNPRLFSGLMALGAIVIGLIVFALVIFRIERRYD
ncbi:MAG: hypothetical protein AB1656_22565 [Candidatus Omnitrophota bacterium]